MMAGVDVEGNKAPPEISEFFTPLNQQFLAMLIEMEEKDLAEWPHSRKMYSPWATTSKVIFGTIGQRSSNGWLQGPKDGHQDPNPEWLTKQLHASKRMKPLIPFSTSITHQATTFHVPGWQVRVDGHYIWRICHRGAKWEGKKDLRCAYILNRSTMNDA